MVLSKEQKKWYSLIEKQGFEEIERFSEHNHLKVWHNTIYRRGYNNSFFQAKRDYYYYAGHFLNEFKFNAKLDKFIWALHSNGVSERSIVKMAKKKFNDCCVYKWKVHKVLCFLRGEMFFKYGIGG